MNEVNRHLSRIAAALVAVIAAGITIWGFFPPSVAEKISNQAIAASDGYFYINLPDHLRYAELRPDSIERPNGSSLRLYENGAPLGPAHSLHADIAQHGHGRFSHWDDSVRFSTSDNTDPRGNGRSYSVKYSLFPPHWLELVANVLLFALALVLVMPFTARHARTAGARIMRALASRALVVWLACALTAIYCAARLPVWDGYFIPYYSPDSALYFMLAYDISNGKIPIFSIRTPGYPLFLFVALGLGKSVTPIVVFQQLSTLVSGMGLYGAFVRARRWLALPASVAVAGYFLSGDGIIYETLLGPESLYTSAIVAIVACILFGAAARRPAALATASVLMGLAIWLRPAALFFVVVFIATTVLLGWLRYGRRSVIAFGLPCPLLLLVLATYNFATIEQFTLSPWGSVNLIAATSTFWRDSSSYPDWARSALHDMNALISTDDQVILAKSWNPQELFSVYDRYYNLSVHKVLHDRLAGYNDINASSPIDPGDRRVNEVLKRISFDAIQDSPLRYLQFVYANAFYFFWVGPQKYWSYRMRIEDRYQVIYGPALWAPSLRTADFRRFALREFQNPLLLENFYVSQGAGGPVVTVRSTKVLELHERVSVYFFSWAYDGRLWFLVFLVSTAMLVGAIATPRMRSTAPDCILAASVSALTLLGAGLLVALVELGADRYSYPTRFVYFLSLPFGIWLLVEWFRGRKSPVLMPCFGSWS